MNEPTLYLKPRRAKPFFLHHPWVFSGAVGRVEGTPQKGGLVRVVDSAGVFIGRGMFNADSQIIVRLVSWDEAEAVDAAFWRGKIEAAVRLRQEVLHLPDSTNAYRLVYSESDGLPGLIVDRYGEALVVQFLTAGMAAQQELVLDTLVELLHPRAIIDRSDEDTMDKEAIPFTHGLRRGEAPAGPVEVQSDGLRFLVDLGAGQKTGLFLDQRENRLAAARHVKGRRVLDGFCYTGAFGLTALKLGGAASVLALDRSGPALELARRNAALNGLEAVTFENANVSEKLRVLKRAGERFGAVILDPPKFARSRPGVERALRAYRDINLLAMQLLEPDGILVTCSCSGHVSAEEFLLTLNDSAVEAHTTCQVLERRGQSADHPVISSCPETGYLKCLVCRVTR